MSFFNCHPGLESMKFFNAKIFFSKSTGFQKFALHIPIIQFQNHFFPRSNRANLHFFKSLAAESFFGKRKISQKFHKKFHKKNFTKKISQNFMVKSDFIPQMKEKKLIFHKTETIFWRMKRKKFGFSQNSMVKSSMVSMVAVAAVAAVEKNWIHDERYATKWRMKDVLSQKWGSPGDFPSFLCRCSPRWRSIRLWRTPGLCTKRLACKLWSR